MNVNELALALFGAPRKVEWDDWQPQTLEQHLRGFSRTQPQLSVGTLLDILGIPNGATVTVDVEEDGSITVEAQHQAIGLDHLDTLLFREDGRWEITLQDITVREDHQQHGLATLLLLHAFHAAARLGFECVRLIGLRSPMHQGYAIWPVLGFDGLLEDTPEVDLLERLRIAVRERLQDETVMRSLSTVQDVLALDGGRVIWTTFGFTLSLEFDLRDASPSWTIFAPYCRQKGVSLLKGWYAWKGSRRSNCRTARCNACVYRKPCCVPRLGNGRWPLGRWVEHRN
jgi:GNAT superfamily N-acetyltransferase